MEDPVRSDVEVVQMWKSHPGSSDVEVVQMWR